MLSFDFSSAIYRSIIGAGNTLSSRKGPSLLRTSNIKQVRGKAVRDAGVTAARKNTATKSRKNSITVYCSSVQKLRKINWKAGRNQNALFSVKSREIL